MSTHPPLEIRPGERLRSWRRRRGLSQLDLAIRASTSQRHVSFVEQGRSRPGRAMLIRLAESLSMPLRDRNELLISAGYVPAYSTEPLDSAHLAPVREALGHLLSGFDPYPAIVVDTIGTIVDRNRSAELLFGGAAAHLLVEPINAYRLLLHPEGLAPFIVNFGTWSHHVMASLREAVARTGDPRMAALADDLQSHVPVAEAGHDHLGFAVPVEITTPEGPLRLTTTLMTFQTTTDVSLSELRLEAFLPADGDTAARLGERFHS